MFSIRLAQTVAPPLFMLLGAYLGVQEDATEYGKAIAGFVAGSYLLSVPFYLLSGREYAKKMESKN